MNSRQNIDNASHFGFRDIEQGRKQGMVDEVFAQVASRYDLMNDLMSGGLHRLWKDATITWLAPPRNARTFRHIDVAGGTGDIAFRVLDAAGPGTRVNVCDINNDMLHEGRLKAERQGRGREIDFTQGNAECLPFADIKFDAYTIAFGLRNVPDIQAALREAYRVLKPGGRFLCLEFSQVDIPMLDRLYDLYSFNAIPIMGGLVAGDSESYRYLVESIRKFPDQDKLAGLVRDAGFARVKYRNLSGGIAAIHSGWRI